MSPGAFNRTVENKEQTIQGSKIDIKAVDSIKEGGISSNSSDNDTSGIGCLGRLLLIFEKRKNNTHHQTTINISTTKNLSNKSYNINQMSVNTQNLVQITDKYDSNQSKGTCDCVSENQLKTLNGNEKTRLKSTTTQSKMKNKKYLKAREQFEAAPTNVCVQNDDNISKLNDNDKMISKISDKVEYGTQIKNSSPKVKTTNDDNTYRIVSSMNNKISLNSSSPRYSEIISSDDEDDAEYVIEPIPRRLTAMRPDLDKLITQLDAEALRLNDIIVGNSIDGASEIYVKRKTSPKSFRPRKFEKPGRRSSSLVYMNTGDITQITEDDELINFGIAQSKVCLNSNSSVLIELLFLNNAISVFKYFTSLD